MREEITLRKPTSDEGETTIEVNVLERAELAIGGFEGPKYLMQVEIGRGSMKYLVQYFVKDGYRNPLLRPAKVRKLCHIYGVLARKGYPVPQMARYFDTGEGISLVLSDMTCAGAYRIWGISDSVTEEYRQSLTKFNLGEEEFTKVESMVKSLTTQATQDGVWLPYHGYQLRQHIDTGEIDIVLLDLDTSTFKFAPADPVLVRKNAESAACFLDSVKHELQVLKRDSEIES